jgi:hypothetical protein
LFIVVAQFRRFCHIATLKSNAPNQAMPPFNQSWFIGMAHQWEVFEGLESPIGLNPFDINCIDSDLVLWQSNNANSPEGPSFQ